MAGTRRLVILIEHFGEIIRFIIMALCTTSLIGQKKSHARLITEFSGGSRISQKGTIGLTKVVDLIGAPLWPISFMF